MNLNEYLVDLILSNYFRHGVAAVLVLCAGAIIWSIFPHAAKASANVTQTVTGPSRASIGSSVEKIAAAHLFGQSAADAADAPPAVAVATINVQGLFYSEDKDVARAILEIDGKTDVFKAGDTLPDGETLAAIGEDAVQIANGPVLRVVELPAKFGNAGSGIQLEGMPDLYAQQDSFPGSRALGRAAPPVVQRLRTVVIPQGGDPISQMRALREQLIKH